jgi:uncharacterized membrane protein
MAETETGSFWSSRKLQLILTAWLILGSVAFVAAMIIYKPWTPALGVGNSPQRYPLEALWSLGVSMPLAFLLVNLFIRHNEWLAPRGAYQPGRTYKVWTTERYVGIAISCAFFVMCGVASPGASIDFPWAGVTFASVYFGIIEGVVGVGILGFILRGLVWGLSPRTLWILWNDVALCAMIAYFYRAVIEKNERERGGLWKNEGFIFVVYVVFHYLAYWFAWCSGRNIAMYPIPEIYARYAYLIGWWTFTGISSAAAAFLVTRQLIKVVERRQRASQ